MTGKKTKRATAKIRLKKKRTAKSVESLASEFLETYCSDTGVIEGTTRPLILAKISHTSLSTPEHAAKFGCPAGEDALLVGWVPAGMRYRDDPKHPLAGPKEAGVDKKSIPPKSTWVTFPKEFKGEKVFYRRASKTWARGK